MDRDDILKLAQLMMTTKHTSQYKNPLYCFDGRDIVAFFHAAQKLEREACTEAAIDAIAFNGGTVQMVPPGYVVVPLCLTPAMRCELLNAGGLDTSELYARLLEAAPKEIDND